jgi:peptidoglycan/LPS O-acetylase OafA/YrhL
VVGPWATRLPAREYWFSRQTWSYFGVTWLSVYRFLPGVFESNPIAHVVNGSLWTIPFEVRWYLILMVLGMVGILRWRWLVLFFLVAVAWISLVRYQAGAAPVPKWIYQLGVFFLAGVVLHRFRIWAARPASSALVLACAATLSWLIGWRYLAVLLVVPFAVIWLGNQSTPLLRRAGRFGDPSYGLYLYAFPVQQLVVFLTQNRLSFWPALSLCLTVTVVLAYASWHGVEKPFLKLKRHLPYGAARQ